jgi:hypothetical protein
MSTLDDLLGPEAARAPRPQGWPAELREHLSASSLGTFLRCPEQFRRVYLLGQRARPGAALVWGSADHYAHEQNFAQKILSHTDIAKPEVELAFAEGFDRSIDEQGGEGEVDWGDDKPSALKDKGVKLVGVYHEQVSPRVQPTAVEKAVKLELEGVPVPVIGRVDIATETTLIEGKTAASKKREPEPQWRLQGALYQLATGLPLEWHVKTKTKLPAVYTPLEEPGLRFVASKLLLDTTVERMRRVVASMLYLYSLYGADEPWPTAAPDYGWACGYCGFRPECVWWKDGAVPLGQVPAGEIPFEAHPDPEYVTLERQLRAVAHRLEIEAEIETRIAASRAIGDEPGHVAWLKTQLETAAVL